MYFNTTNVRGDDLRKEWKNANAQEQKIVAVFQSVLGYFLSFFEVLERSGLRALITSIRRAMTNLTREGVLEKTEVTRMGPYGKPSYCWKLKI